MDELFHYLNMTFDREKKKSEKSEKKNIRLIQFYIYRKLCPLCPLCPPVWFSARNYAVCVVDELFLLVHPTTPCKVLLGGKK